jgi:membrane associated rhomboid family serine protease
MKAWLAVCGLLGGGSVLVAWLTGVAPPVPEWPAHPLAWQASNGWRQPWTLWTSAWVHTSLGNLGGNLLALVGLAVAGAALGARRPAAIALLAAWPVSTLALLAWPEVTHFSGLGGVIHAAAAVLGMHAAARPSLKPLSPLLFAALGLKLLAERAWSQPVAFDPSWGFNVVYAAHLTGAFAGIVFGALAVLFERIRGRQARR